MKLEFDSVEDLDHFLSWAADYRGHILTEPAAQGVSLTFPVFDAQQPLQPTAGLVDGEVAFDTPPASDALAPANMPPAEPQKRKRRTKAEIEADEKAAAAAAQEGVKAEEPTTADTAAVATAQPQGANPFAQAATTPGQGPVATETTSLPAGDGTAETGTSEGDPAEAVVTPFQHITRAREFIAKHQIHKYNETFAKAELDANVMAYTPEQRAKHMAVMDEFDKA